MSKAFTSTHSRLIEVLSYAAIVGLTTYMQLHLSHVGLHYDDYLVFRHYPPIDVVRSFWTDIAVVTSPDLWISAYRPMTLVAHATLYELFGFLPDNLLIARVIMQTLIGILCLRWLRLLGLGVGPALLGALVFIFYPINFHVFTWSTELGALSGMVWFLLSLILQSSYFQHDRRPLLWASYLCWALALLTKEVVVPVTIIFPLLQLLYGKQQSIRTLVVGNTPYFLLLAVYLVVRTVVLQGKWGGQGISPDSVTLGQFMASAAVNYSLFLQNISLANTVTLLHPSSPLPAFLASLPVAIMFCIALYVAHDGWLRTSQDPERFTHRVRAFEQAEVDMKCAILGFSLLLFGGLICCFYVADRVTYVSTLGCGLICAALVHSALERFRFEKSRLGITLLATACVAQIATCQFLFAQRATSPTSPFVRLAEKYDLEAYFMLGHLFQQWNEHAQSVFLREKLLSQSLIDSTGRPQADVISAILEARGFSIEETSAFVDSISNRTGAGELLRSQ